jgi:hypothetical protein
LSKSLLEVTQVRVAPSDDVKIEEERSLRRVCDGDGGRLRRTAEVMPHERRHETEGTCDDKSRHRLETSRVLYGQSRMGRMGIWTEVSVFPCDKMPSCKCRRTSMQAPSLTPCFYILQRALRSRSVQAGGESARTWKALRSTARTPGTSGP